MNELRVAPEAEEELAAAVGWYEGRRAELGLELLVDIDQTLAMIRETPLSAPLWHADRPYRKKVLRRFPYAIFFRLQGAVVVVDAFAHVRRRPGYWLDLRSH